MKNREVAKAWRAGRAAAAGNFRTDGQNLWSYNLQIGRTESGSKVLTDYRRRVSVTTSRHCGLAAVEADRIE
jgi:hypothetical protein